MNLLGKLFTIEWIKVRKRSVFWVAIVAHATIISAGLGVQQYIHYKSPKSPPFTLPAGWSELVNIGAQIGMLMLLIAITLLTASEAGWRTQRQNVIDGLSRAHYFTGKLMIALLIAFVLWIDMTLLGLIIAPLGGKGAFTWPVFDSLATRMLPNALLYFCAMATTAFMFGMIASTSGAALGLTFALVIVEPLIGGIMMMKGGVLPAMSQYLPLDVFNNLVARRTYNPEMTAQFAAMMQKAGRPAPLSLQTSIIVTVIYIAAFIGITWLAFRTRDL